MSELLPMRGWVIWGDLRGNYFGESFLLSLGISREYFFAFVGVDVRPPFLEHVPLNRLGSLEKESHPKAAKPKSVQVDPGHRSG